MELVPYLSSLLMQNPSVFEYVNCSSKTVWNSIKKIFIRKIHALPKPGRFHLSQRGASRESRIFLKHLEHWMSLSWSPGFNFKTSMSIHLILFWVLNWNWLRSSEKSNLDHIDLKLVFVFSKSSILILFFILQGIIMSLIIESVLASDVQSRGVTKKITTPLRLCWKLNLFQMSLFNISTLKNLNDLRK